MSWQSIFRTNKQRENQDAQPTSMMSLLETQRLRLIAACIFATFLNLALAILLVAAHGFDVSAYNLNSALGHGLLSACMYLIVVTTALVLAIRRIAVPLVCRVSICLVALIVMYDVAMAGGLYSVNGPVLLILPAIASLILRPRDTVVLAILNVIGIIVITSLQYQGGILPTAALSGDIFLISMALVMIIGSITASGMAFVTVRNHERSEIRLRSLLRRSARLTAKLKEERARFEDFSDVASDWLFEVDKHGVCTYSAGRLMASFQGGSDRVVGLHRDEIVQALT
ncbi:MAG: hypothetical protein ABJQ14_00360, partial [Hyphomicrobiales bacterium]